MFPVAEQFRRQFSADVCIVTDRLQQRRLQTAAAQSKRSLLSVVDVVAKLISFILTL